MKKIITLILLICMVLSLAACGKVEITMQEIYDASKTEDMLKDHQSVSVRVSMDGELFMENYLTKEYACGYSLIDEEGSVWAEFITEDKNYYYDGNNYLRYFSVAPDGLSNFPNLFAEQYKAVMGEEVLNDTIESVSKKDGRITVNSTCSQEISEEFGVVSGKFEYVLDAKTRELISYVSDYTYDDGTEISSYTEISYDAEAPEIVKTLLKYAEQTEDLRNITIVNNPGTDKEKTESANAPKGLVIGIRYDEENENEFEVYADAACTVAYDPYADTDSDLTIYVKWVKKAA